MEERLIYIVEELSGHREVKTCCPIRAYGDYESAKMYAEEMNAAEDERYQTVLKLENQLEAVGTDRNIVNEQVFRSYLKDADPRLLSAIELVDSGQDLNLSEEEEETLYHYGAKMDRFLAAHKNGVYKRYAMSCGYDEETVEMMEVAIDYDIDDTRRYFYVSKNGIPFYHD